jgi:hypothetical protein
MVSTRSYDPTCSSLQHPVSLLSPHKYETRHGSVGVWSTCCAPPLAEPRAHKILFTYFLQYFLLFKILFKNPLKYFSKPPIQTTERGMHVDGSGGIVWNIILVGISSSDSPLNDYMSVPPFLNRISCVKLLSTIAVLKSERVTSHDLNPSTMA